MKGTDWGRIMARVTAIVIVVRALDYIYHVIDIYALDRRYNLGQSPAIDSGRISIALVLFFIALLLWLYSYKFAPSDDAELDTRAEPDKFIIALVSAVGMFIFLRYASMGLSNILYFYLSRNEINPPNIEPHAIFSLVMALASVFLVVQARKSTMWLLR